ncbi:hypothetical protein M422DRAFT_252492 [Sphaerobolus stellatus SS14]|uniref:Uncharacterized protein n=1 Tax=Sphaerobolus stellatus (strain SS14) TaxID=990650 RepID=A0A0C9ULT8_SPHS4|nr:hypothetical protein M422DRAFT_252492 [Sphaerobolus stellatus SS14]
MVFIDLFISGTDYTTALLKDVDAENLPSFLGGKCTCEGTGGCKLSSAGPWLDGRVYHGHGPSKYRPKDDTPADMVDTPMQNGVTTASTPSKNTLAIKSETAI